MKARIGAGGGVVVPKLKGMDTLTIQNNNRKPLYSFAVERDGPPPPRRCQEGGGSTERESRVDFLFHKRNLQTGLS